MPRNKKKFKCVTVRIWEARPPSDDYPYGTVGHAALQTYSDSSSFQTGTGVYASFWPAERLTKDSIKSGVRGALHTHQQDLKAEGQTGIIKKSGGQPDLEVDLYGLDIETINATYRKFAESGYNWAMFGSSFFGDSNTCNCSGLVAFLLYEGGIRAKRWQYASTCRIWGVTIGALSALWNKEFMHVIYGLMIGGAIGGIADGYKDATEIYNVLVTITTQTGQDTEWQYVALKNVLHPLGIIIGPLTSAIGITNALQWMTTTPNHISELVENAADDLEDIRYPTLN